MTSVIHMSLCCSADEFSWHEKHVSWCNASCCICASSSATSADLHEHLIYLYLDSRNVMLGHFLNGSPIVESYLFFLDTCDLYVFCNNFSKDPQMLWISNFTNARFSPGIKKPYEWIFGITVQNNGNRVQKEITHCWKTSNLNCWVHFFFSQ